MKPAETPLVGTAEFGKLRLCLDLVVGRRNWVYLNFTAQNNPK